MRRSSHQPAGTETQLRARVLCAVEGETVRSRQRQHIGLLTQQSGGQLELRSNPRKFTRLDRPEGNRHAHRL